MRSPNLLSAAPIATAVILLIFSHPLLAATDESPVVDQRNEKVRARDTGAKIVFEFGNQKILEFNHKKVNPPKGIDQIYARSGYIHPLFTPSGKMVTDDFSDDHAHQHGLFNAFVKAKVSGKSLDFWNQHKRTANVKCDSVRLDPQNPSQAITVQTHYRLSDSKPIFRETWTIDVSVQKECFVVDLKSDIVNVSGENVTIEKNHYGSFGFRGSGQWRKPKETEFEFATEAGNNRKSGNLKREKWVAMTGKIDGESCGVAVLSHSDNFRFPQPARLHPTMPYFSFAPMQLGSYDIPDGKGVTARYRIITFDGNLDREKLETLDFKSGGK